MLLCTYLHVTVTDTTRDAGMRLLLIINIYHTISYIIIIYIKTFSQRDRWTWNGATSGGRHD